MSMLDFEAAVVNFYRKVQYVMHLMHYVYHYTVKRQIFNIDLKLSAVDSPGWVSKKIWQ